MGQLHPDGIAGRCDGHGVYRDLRLDSLRKLRSHPRSSSIVMLATVAVLGLNGASTTIVDRFGVQDKPVAVEQLIH